FVNHRDNDWGAAGLVVKNVRKLILNFLLHNIKVNFASVEGAGNFLLKVLTNHTHELFAVTEVNEPTANDVRAGHKATTSLLYGKHHHEHTLTRHVDTVFKDHF